MEQVRRKTLETGPREQVSAMHVLVIHDVLPLTDRSGSDVRLMQVLRALRAQGHAVTYIARNAINQQAYTKALEKLGIRIYANDAERLRYAGIDVEPQWTLEEVLREQRFDLAILFHWFWSGISVAEHYLEEIRRLSPETVTAVLTDDFHGLRERRSAELTGFLSDWERACDYEQREMEIYRRADLVLSISEDDRQKFLALAPDLEIELLPLAAEVAPPGPGFLDRNGLLFIGNFDNPANMDGLQWLLREVWPEVRRRLPDISLDVVGNNAPGHIASPETGVACLGRIADLEPEFARHRVFISPIRWGTGIKTKNVAALAHGLPLVTTTVGAEGMNLQDQQQALIADSAAAFAQAIVQANTDAALWEALARQGRERLQREFSAERLDAHLQNIIRRSRQLRPVRNGELRPCSCLLVEQAYPEMLVRPQSSERLQFRLLGYVRLAERLLAEGRPAAAREQLRHIFTFVRGPVPRNGFFLRVLQNLERCYSELGEQKGAERCRIQAQRCAVIAAGEKLARPARVLKSRRMRSSSRGGRPEISVVIPTYNRRDTLGSCLLALSGQTLPPEQFEAIVVDDGSTDGTEDLCRKLSLSYPAAYIRQANAGPGMARRTGIEHSKGKYVLFFNDDTIASPDLLAEHLQVHRAHPREQWAVLGDFRYREAARQHALTYFLNTNPFLFPQSTMQSGQEYGYAYFVTCNLSIRRDAILAAGSFDPQFHVAEDTELGVRLDQQGYRVYYHAPALAWHDHLSITMRDLVRRAQAYGRADLRLFRKYPQLLGDGSGPFGMADEAAVLQIREYLDRNRADVEDALRSLEQFDNLDFIPYFTIRSGESTAADEVAALFSKAVPAVYWFYLYESFLQAWTAEQEAEEEQAAEFVCEAHG